MPPRAVLKGPTMSRPQTAKGQVMGIVLRAVDGVCFGRLKMLAAGTSVDDLLRVLQRGEPEETMAKCFGHDGSRCCVVSTLALVDFFEQPAAFFWVYAALVDARDVALIELFVNDGVGVGSTLDLPSQDLVLREFAVGKVGDKRLRPASGVDDGEDALFIRPRRWRVRLRDSW